MDTTITIKTNKKLRDAAKRTALKLGIPLTTVINAKLTEFVREGRFEVSLQPRREAVREVERTVLGYRENPEAFTRSTAAEFTAWLRKE